ncbi:GT4 family glycosyltransferase PelF [Kocuria sp.]|uniref:GT4 family glycosyltransferase PelF n=1 Tax=Kocuria sp. TaxID=1871328 RepID=UPI0026DC0437|nr:GT4 family glycosyltransferase PelF [Kocuria sp.]MDO4918278.1 GT4 family glycosyltransferase PelF [Kocuria sp.]
MRLFSQRPLRHDPRHRLTTAGDAPTVPAAEVEHSRQFEDVDVAIIMESTYPYLKGGVSAVVHDIVTGNPDLSYGIIHIAWDSEQPREDLYGMPENVKWVRVVFLSMQEHRHDFMAARPADLGMTSQERTQLSHRIFDALYALSEEREVAPLWDLVDEGFNERTREYPLWAVLGSQEFMAALTQRMPQLNLSLSDSFWLLRGFFSLAFAILSETMPRAKVYHAHTTGYASLLGAAAARDHGTSFLLTEHNLYVRDTVNTLLERNMALSITSEDYRTFDVPPEQRAWMAWWIEMGHFCYPSAEVITYLYPTAITEAASLGTDIDRSVVLPNGMVIEEFEQKYHARQAVLEEIVRDPAAHTWRLVYIARVVPIKGLMDLLSSLDLLRQWGFPNVHLDVLGPTEHVPEYYEACLEKIESLGLQDMVTIHGTVNVRDILERFDLLVLPSYNEGQPIVVLEAMAAGIPTVGSEVGGMGQLVRDELRTADGREWGPCGELLAPGDVEAMARKVQAVIGNLDTYRSYALNARGRVEDFFQLHEVMASYNRIYRMLGGMDGRNYEYAGSTSSAESRR